MLTNDAGYPGTTISPEDLTDMLKLTHAVDSAIIDDDGDIFAKNGNFSCWIRINAEKRAIKFYNYTTVTEKDNLGILKFVNACNENVPKLSFAYSEAHERIFGTYEFCFFDDIDKGQFIRSFHDFICGYYYAIFMCDLNQCVRIVSHSEEQTSTDSKLN